MFGICCRSFFLHDVGHLICIFLEIYIFSKTPSSAVETHSTSYCMHSGTFFLCGKVACSLRLVLFQAKFKNHWSYTPLPCTTSWRARRQLQFHFTCFKTIVTLYAFFWVNPRRVKFTCRRFGTLCSIFIGR